MNHLTSFPKIFSLGTSYVTNLLLDEVEVTEKVDGSQFVFGLIEGRTLFRSKGREIFPESVDKMFGLAVARVLEMTLEPGLIYYCEYLNKPKHNCLTYSRVPKNNLVLYGVQHGLGGEFEPHWENLLYQSIHLGIDVAPLMARGRLSVDDLRGLMGTDSYLGGCKIEGVVVKNYTRKFLLGGQPMPLMAAKLVSEDFKEINHSNFKKENTGKGRWDTFKEGYRTEARWNKALQHLRDDGVIKDEGSDIGHLIREVRKDIVLECKTEIKEFLWQEFGEELLRKAVAGLPEWYKGKLAEHA